MTVRWHLSPNFLQKVSKNKTQVWGYFSGFLHHDTEFYPDRFLHCTGEGESLPEGRAFSRHMDRGLYGEKGPLTSPESLLCSQNSSCFPIRYQASEMELHEEEIQACPSR